MAYVFLLHGRLKRPVAALGAIILTLTACTTDVLTPPDSVDRTGSVRSSTLQSDRAARYPARRSPVATLSETTGAAALPAVDIDGMIGGGPVVGLAEEQNREITQEPAAPPVVDGIGTDGVHALAATAAPISTAAMSEARLPDAGAGDPDLPPLGPASIAAEERRQAQFLEQEQRVMLQRRAQAEEQQVAFLPRAQNPAAAPNASSPEPGGPLPASEIACRQRLAKIGVQFRDVPRIANGPSCGIDHPVKISGLSGGIAVKPAVTLNCEVTEAFALWVKNELAPSVRFRYLTGLATIKPLGGYSCRTMNSRRGAAMSEHAHGNAIDVGKFVLNTGREIDVRKPGFFSFREKGLLKAVRGDSCKYFNTVLGPGSDPYHKDHFHFDLRNRKTGYRHCD